MPVLTGKELRIVGFLCNWCSYGGADTAGVGRFNQPTDLRIIRETPAYPRALEMVRGDLDDRVKRRLREVLLAAADDPDAREALLRFFKTTRFAPIDTSTEHALEHLREGVARVGREVA